MDESVLGEVYRSDAAGGAAAAAVRRPVRSIWISDLHLGTRRCRAGELLQFLDRFEAEIVYLVGDIVDGWVSGPAWHWSEEQGAVVQRLTQWQRAGARVQFLPGNHDELSLDLAQALLGPLPVADEVIHRTADGRRMLVIHGHQFDGWLNPNRWMSVLGPQAYHKALRLDRWYSEEGFARENGPVSAGLFFKRRLGRTIRYLTDFRDRSVLERARTRRADGVICGHTHYAERRRIGPISYFNDGDWVKSCTALIEYRDGSLHLLGRDRTDADWCELPQPEEME